MKQHITKKQWDELDKKILIEAFGEYGYHEDDIIIGRMIEFLGVDLWRIELEGVLNKPWSVDFTLKGKLCGRKSRELCDALWEAVKYKLKQ